jgi:hypothetical protein
MFPLLSMKAESTSFTPRTPASLMASSRSPSLMPPLLIACQSTRPSCTSCSTLPFTNQPDHLRAQGQLGDGPVQGDHAARGCQSRRWPSASGSGWTRSGPLGRCRRRPACRRSAVGQADQHQPVEEHENASDGHLPPGDVTAFPSDQVVERVDPFHDVQRSGLEPCGIDTPAAQLRERHSCRGRAGPTSATADRRSLRRDRIAGAVPVKRETPTSGARDDLLRRVRSRLGRRHGGALERQSPRCTLAGDGYSVRDVGWRESTGSGAAAGGHHRRGVESCSGKDTADPRSRALA